MKLYLSHCRENKANTQYPTAAEITGLDDLKKAAQRDHIAAEMREAHRSNGNFIKADCVMLDLDNTHSDEPADWKTTDDIAETFPEVPFYYIHSRNHMKPKTKKASNGTVTHYEPRGKYHCYFPLSRAYTNREEYEALLLKAAGLFPFFDLAAAKPAQFFFGVEKPTGGMEEGGIYLDQYLETQDTATIAAAVNEFANKVKAGIYKRDGENENAISRLYAYLGIQEPHPHTAPAADAPETTGGQDTEYSQLGYAIAEGEQRQRLAWLQTWAQQHNVALGRTYRIKSREHPDAVCICVTCPWEHEHSMNGSDNEAVIIIELGGKLSFLCRHSHGALYGWKEYRAYYEIRDAQQETAGEQEAQLLPGLLTYNDAVNVFETADDRTVELKSFPLFSKAAKIHQHDSIVIAADTGAGKSSLAINFLNDLNNDYPCIYINLEMGMIDILRRLTAIHSGIEIDRIEGYRHDEKTAAAVNTTLQTITSRKPLQVIQGVYMLQEIENLVQQSIKGREEPTIVFIDHSLLVDTKSRDRYDRFTQVSEGLRKMALNNNIILFVLLQQNRAGKAAEEERPRNNSLKESGSWENDATQICFLWYDPIARRKKLLLTKNRHGICGEFALNCWQKTQTYTEAAGDETAATQAARGMSLQKQSKREKQRQKLLTAYETAYFTTFGKPTLQAIAEAADVTTTTIKTWLKEYGGFMVGGKPIDPAGIDAVIERQEFIKLTPADDAPFNDQEHPRPVVGNGREITASF